MILRRRVRSYVHGSHVAKDGFTRRAAGGDNAVVWANLVHTTDLGGGTLEKTSGGTTYNAGAVSTRKISAGYVETTRADDTRERIFGLSLSDDDFTLADTEYTFYWLPGSTNFRIYESGTKRTLSETGLSDNPWSLGDVFRISISGGGVVTYYQNGTLIHTSAVAASGSYQVDVSLNEVGTKIEDAMLVAS